MSIFGNTNVLAALTPGAAKANGFTGVPYVSTGILPFIEWSEKQGLVTPATLSAVVPEIPGVFGGFPFPMNSANEIGPSAFFVAVFALLGLGHLYVWLKNYSRGHNFFFSLGVAFYCLLKLIGFAIRIAWAHDITRLKLGIASIAFVQIAPLVVLTMNMILAHRILTWRHPETGVSWPIVWFINQVYFLVFVIITMAIVGETLPYVRFMTEYHYHICRNVTKAAAVFNLIYTLIPFQFIGTAFLLKPGSLIPHPWQKKYNGLPPVFQASWIKSAGMFYFVPKNSQHIVYKNEPAAEAVRIMPSREPPSSGEYRSQHAPMHPDSPRFSHAVIIVLISSFVYLLNTTMRTAGTFKAEPYGTLDGNHIKISFWPYHPYVAYIFYGATEALVCAMFLVTRVDLRFYLPDMPKSAKKNPRGSGQIADVEEYSTIDPETKQHVDTESGSVDRY